MASKSTQQQIMEDHRFSTCQDIVKHARDIKTIKQHQKNIIELLNDIRDEPLAQAYHTGVYDDLLEYLENEFLMDNFKSPESKVKVTDSSDGIYCKGDGKITKSRDAFEKSWIEKGYDYFAYVCGSIDVQGTLKYYRKYDIKVN